MTLDLTRKSQLQSSAIAAFKDPVNDPLKRVARVVSHVGSAGSLDSKQQAREAATVYLNGMTRYHGAIIKECKDTRSASEAVAKCAIDFANSFGKIVRNAAVPEAGGSQLEVDLDLACRKPACNYEAGQRSCHAVVRFVAHFYAALPELAGDSCVGRCITEAFMFGMRYFVSRTLGKLYDLLEALRKKDRSKVDPTASSFEGVRRFRHILFVEFWSASKDEPELVKRLEASHSFTREDAKSLQKVVSKAVTRFNTIQQAICQAFLDKGAMQTMYEMVEAMNEQQLRLKEQAEAQAQLEAKTKEIAQLRAALAPGAPNSPVLAECGAGVETVAGSGGDCKIPDASDKGVVDLLDLNFDDSPSAASLDASGASAEASSSNGSPTDGNSGRAVSAAAAPEQAAPSAGNDPAAAATSPDSAVSQGRGVDYDFGLGTLVSAPVAHAAHSTWDPFSEGEKAEPGVEHTAFGGNAFGENAFGECTPPQPAAFATASVAQTPAMPALQSPSPSPAPNTGLQQPSDAPFVHTAAPAQPVSMRGSAGNVPTPVGNMPANLATSAFASASTGSSMHATNPFAAPAVPPPSGPNPGYIPGAPTPGYMPKALFGELDPVQNAPVAKTASGRVGAPMRPSNGGKAVPKDTPPAILIPSAQPSLVREMSSMGMSSSSSSSAHAVPRMCIADHAPGNPFA